MRSWSLWSYFKELLPTFTQNIKIFFNRHAKFWCHFSWILSLNQHILFLEFMVRITHSRKVTITQGLYIVMVLEKSCMLSKYVINLKTAKPGKNRIRANWITTNLRPKNKKKLRFTEEVSPWDWEILQTTFSKSSTYSSTFFSRIPVMAKYIESNYLYSLIHPFSIYTEHEIYIETGKWTKQSPKIPQKKGWPIKVTNEERKQQWPRMHPNATLWRVASSFSAFK